MYLKTTLWATLLTACVTLAACSSDHEDRVASGHEEKVLRVGAVVSETGRYAGEGGNVRRGYILWQDWVNNDYGGLRVGGDRYEVELVMYDDGSDPDTTADLVVRLIEEDEVDFLLGPYSSTLTERAIEVAEARGMVLVEGNGASESLFRQSYANLFAVLTPAGNYAQSALEALADAGARSVAIAHTDAIFPTSVAEGAAHWAEAYGLEVTGIEAYPQDTADVTRILAAFKELDPDVFVGAGYFGDAVLFVRTAQATGFSPRALVLTVGPTDPAFADAVGQAAANYLIGPTQWESSMGYEGDYFGSAAEYAERYASMWGRPPVYQAALATAAGLALQLGIEAAGSLEQDAVRAALGELDVDTFAGRIRFDETGKNTYRSMGAIQIQDGDILVVAPAAAAVADVIYPVPGRMDR